MTRKDINTIYRLFKEADPKILQIKKAAGQTNRNFLVTFGDEKFFVRLPWENDSLNRTVEGENILRLVRNHKLKIILPKYYIYILKGRNILDPNNKEVFDVPDGTLVTKSLQGKEFTVDLLQHKKMLEALVRMFHIFHSSGVRLVNTYDVFHNEIENYRTKAEKFPITRIVSSARITMMKQIEKIAQAKFSLSKKRSQLIMIFYFRIFL